MFKKIISLIIVLSVAISLVACSKAPNTTSVLSTYSTSEPTYESTQEPTLETTTIETTEKIVYRELILPTYVITSDPFDGFDLDGYVKEQNFVSASVREDGNVVVVVTEQRYEEYKSKFTKDTDEAFASIINGEETPYIKDIKRNEDFSHFEVTIDQQIVDDTLDWNLFGIILSVSTYQTIFQIEYKLQLDLIDFLTGEVYDSHTIPEAES